MILEIYPKVSEQSIYGVFFVCCQVTNVEDVDGRLTMTAVVSSAEQVHQRSMGRSITRLLQHSILQLCNEHIGYSHKLQILGVLCMTVDDEQQELVVKVNNTLKRVAPVTPKDGAQLHATGMPPGVQTQTIPQQVHAHHQMNSGTGSDHSVNTSNHTGGAAAATTKDDSLLNTGASPSPSPVPLNMTGRRSHGRKGTNPVKVEQVYEEDQVESDEEDEDVEALTVIPQAPEVSMDLSSGSPSPTLTTQAASSSTSSSSSSRPRTLGPSGSAKRKPSHLFRVPQYPSPSGSPYTRSLPADSAGSPYMIDSSRADDTTTTTESSTSYHMLPTSSKVTPHGISLPIYVAGTYSQENSEGDDQPMNLASIRSNAASPSDRPNGQDQMNGSDSREGSPSSDRHSHSAKGERPSSNSSLRNRIYNNDNHSLNLKDEPDEDSENDMRDPINSFDEYARATLFQMGENVERDVRMEGLQSQIPYAGLGLFGVGRHNLQSTGSPSARDSDGLTIKYTSTGPYTVGANGKDVSNSSRIKDIIMYDDQSPLSQQKGARIETDYIVDKLGMDGRKRRRRAPEDQLTAEEIAEYLGQPERSEYSFRCKYCTEEFDSVTRYIHHTLASHQAYICHQCGKSFTTKSSLLRHRPIHTGMRRFACSICKKTFYRKDKCKAHIKRHLGVDQNSDRYPTVEAAHIEAAHIEAESP